MTSHRFGIRAATGIFVLMSILSGFFGVSVLFTTDDPFPREANALIATFAAGMAVFGIAITMTGFRRGQWWAWLALWYYPVFFVIHSFAFGTIIPDGIFAVLTTAALLLARPTRSADSASPAVTERRPGKSLEKTVA